MPGFRNLISGFLDELPRRRYLRNVFPLADGCVEGDGRVLKDFASNDYLGLALHPRVVAGARKWLEQFGTGATGSRLVSGNHRDIALIEKKICGLKRTPAALLLTCGFAANSTIVAALLDHRLHGGRAHSTRAVVFADRQVHASLLFGIAASGARCHRFRHNDLRHLAKLLEEHADGRANPLIVTESVFSMDGDRADIDALRELAERFDALLLVDEAHATGVLGPGGGGLTAFSRPKCDEIVTGTWGKAAGSFGAYAACDEVMREYLVNRCGGLIYATALPPPVLGAIDAALDLFPEMDLERNHIASLASRFREQMHQANIDTRASDTHIVPVVMGGDDIAMRAAAKLEDCGFFVAAIRPPTVPEGTSRLRITFSAAHDADTVEELADAVIRIIKCQTIAG